MVLDKSCPGSRLIREPRPGSIKCANCGREVEIWTDELKATCPGCGHKVFRVSLVSCLDWCPHAKECVGPDVYERLRPAVAEDLSGVGTPLDILKREHERVLENLGRLRAASLCLKLGTLKPESPLREKGVSHLAKVLDFLNRELGRHFRREEEGLFPALERHFGREKSPTQILRQEHGEIWHWYERLKEKLIELPENGREPAESIPAEVQDFSRSLEQLLREHIKRENESLLPLAKSLLKEAEMTEILNKWQALKV